MSNSSSPILAIACGPIVTTWDISKTRLVSNRNTGGCDIPNTNKDGNGAVDTTSTDEDVANLNANSIHSPPSSSSLATESSSLSSDANLFSSNGSNGSIINLAWSMPPSLIGKLNSMGIRQFKPHGSGYNGTTVKDVVWNHNGQVLATCSDTSSSSTSELNGNVALTLNSTQSKLESFSNFIPPANSSNDNLNSNDIQTTSVTFGGSNAKSRYVCVSDEGGYISVWDMKKEPVKRVRHFRLQSQSQGIADGRNHSRSNHHHLSSPPCSKACIDRSDTFVVGLHGRSKGNSILYDSDSSHVTLDIFHLKNGGIVTSLMDDGTHGGTSDCFHFSNFDTNQLLVGTIDGSLLLWDISSSMSSSSSSTRNFSSGTIPSLSPISSLGKRHNGPVTDVAFSPMNKVLAASCSMDGTIIFHDVRSEKKIQMLRPVVHHNGNNMTSPRSKGDSYNEGLTSLAFHSDGYTWAVGSNDGYVLNYDLRQISAGPLNTLNVGDGIEVGGADGVTGNERKSYPINRLQFAPASSPSNSKTPKTVKKKKSPVVVMDQGQERPHVEQKEQMPVPSQWSSQQQQSPVVEDGNYTTTEEEIDTMKNRQFASPQPSPSLAKELFHRNHNKDQKESSNTISIDRKVVLPLSQENMTLGERRSEDHNMTARPQKRSPEPTSNEDSIFESSLPNDKIRQLSDEDNTETVIKSFDKMYERLKNRETDFQSPQQDSLNASSQSQRKDNCNGSDVFMITKNEIQELVDDAVESLRDDMDDALQNMHCDFMRQLQKQSDETKVMFEMQRKEIEKLVKENAALKAENEQTRLF